MKLWQKLFLSSLSLIIIAIDIVSVTILSNNHRLLLEREKAHAVREFDYFAASFANALTYEQLRSDKVALTDEDISAIADDLFSRSNRPSAAFKTDGTLVAMNIFNELGIPVSDQEYLNSVLNGNNNYTVRIFSDEGLSLLTIGSLTEAAGENYLLITATDVSEIYTMKEQQTRFIRQVSIISAAVVSLILLVTTILLLRPLSRLNTYTKAIAGGNYRIRIRKRGSQEFRELAENMNIMADAVQSHAQRLEKIAEDRQTFIGDLAHEMKTPLTSILGFADLLRIRKNVSDEERMEYASVIVDETKRLRSLSGKLMELTAMSGTEIVKSPVSLNDMIRDTQNALVPVLGKNQVTLKCQCDDITLSADEELFKSLLYNIIENAAKASGKGQEIDLTARKKDGAVVIAITDHGIGMSEEDAAKVFQPFYMVDKSRSRKAGGAGIGLALCEKIASLHFAKLSIKSKLGEGTTVFISIGKEAVL